MKRSKNLTEKSLISAGPKPSPDRNSPSLYPNAVVSTSALPPSAPLRPHSHSPSSSAHYPDQVPHSAPKPVPTTAPALESRRPAEGPQKPPKTAAVGAEVVVAAVLPGRTSWNRYYRENGEYFRYYILAMKKTRVFLDFGDSNLRPENDKSW